MALFDPKKTERLMTMQLRALGWTKIPLLALCRPQVKELTEKRVVIKLPLNRMTKNHWGSMYFGALAVGADVSGGFLAWHKIKQSGADISLIFKDFHAEFMRRPETDTFFICEDGEMIDGLLKRAISSGERQTETVNISAYDENEQKVCHFKLSLSLKRK